MSFHKLGPGAKLVKLVLILLWWEEPLRLPPESAHQAGRWLVWITAPQYLIFKGFAYPFRIQPVVLLPH